MTRAYHREGQTVHSECRAHEANSANRRVDVADGGLDVAPLDALHPVDAVVEQEPLHRNVPLALIEEFALRRVRYKEEDGANADNHCYLDA